MAVAKPSSTSPHVFSQTRHSREGLCARFGNGKASGFIVNFASASVFAPAKGLTRFLNVGKPLGANPNLFGIRCLILEQDFVNMPHVGSLVQPWMSILDQDPLDEPEVGRARPFLGPGADTAQRPPQCEWCVPLLGADTQASWALGSAMWFSSLNVPEGRFGGCSPGVSRESGFLT